MSSNAKRITPNSHQLSNFEPVTNFVQHANSSTLHKPCLADQVEPCSLGDCSTICQAYQRLWFLDAKRMRTNSCVICSICFRRIWLKHRCVSVGVRTAHYTEPDSLWLPESPP